MQQKTVVRNALGEAWQCAQAVANSLQDDHSPQADAVFYAAGLLEIYSRRPKLDNIPQQEMHDIFQQAAPALDKAEHLFNAALHGERVINGNGVQHA